MTEGSILVVLPTLGDRLESLEETLGTIEAQKQDVPLRLVVVLPDGADAARALAERFGATVVGDPRSGISDAINAGILAADGEEFYAWMGDDDLFRPGGLRTLRDLLIAHPKATVSFGACDYIDPAGRTIGTSRAGRAARWLLPWGPDLIPHPGSMIRLDAMRSVGLFDPELRYAMDLDMFLRLRSTGPFAPTKTTVSAFRWHPDSLTVSNRRASSAESEAVKRRHLPRALRAVAPLWEVPGRWAAGRAATAVSARARRIESRQGDTAHAG
jgi:glycosyltransferase involved in cell wall biosynthesis